MAKNALMSNAPDQSDPRAWNAWAQTQDPALYGYQGKRALEIGDLARLKPALTAAGQWNPAWDQALADPSYFGNPGSNEQSSDGSYGQPAQQLDLSSLDGYGMASARSSGRNQISDYFDPSGNLFQQGQITQGGSMRGKDYAEAAAVVGGVLGGGYGLESALGAGAGAAAGGNAGAIANGALAGGAQGGGLGALGATEGGLAAAGAGGSFLGDIGGQPGWDAMNVGADPAAGMYQEAGGGIVDGNAYGGTQGGGNLMDSLGNFFSGNSSLDNYLRAGQLVGGLYAQNKSAGAAQSGNNAQNALLSQMYQQNRSDNQPLMDTRNSALTQINSLLKDPSSITQQPGYQFGLKQGANQLNNRAAASGNYYSGAQMKAAQQFGQDYAGTKLDQSLNRLTNVAGLGQVGANNNQSNNTNFGTAGGNNLAQGGNIRGSGYLGQFNTANGAVNGWQQDDIWNRLLKGGGP